MRISQAIDFNEAELRAIAKVTGEHRASRSVVVRWLKEVVRLELKKILGQSSTPNAGA